MADVETPAAAPPAEPDQATPPSDPGQQAAPPDASPPPASEGEAPPAEPAEGDAPPADDLPDLPDETLANLIDAYGEKWKENPKFKQWVADEANQATQKQLQEAMRRPDADPSYRELSTKAETALKAHVDAIGKYERGEDFDPRELAGTAVAIQEYAEATDRRLSVLDTERALETVIVEANDGKVPEAADPIHSDVVAARGRYQEAMDNASRLRTSGDPRNREKAPVAEAQARAAFVEDQIRNAFNAGKRIGEKQGQAKDEKAQKARVALAKDNALKEAAAKLAAGQTPDLNGNGRTAAKEPTYAELQKMSAEQINKIPSDVFRRITQGGG